MQRLLLTTFTGAALIASAAHAQNSTAVPASNSNPAVVVVTPSLAGPATPANPPPSTAVAQTVYTPQLPSATDLANAAAAQGLTVERIVQTTNQVIAFYRHANGQSTTVAYQALPPSGVAQPSPAPAVVVTQQPAPTVVYRPAPRVVYYDPYPDYPRYWYPPFSLSFGIGYSRGVYHGHHHHHRR